MKLCIDVETCSKNGLSVGEALYLASLYFDSPIQKKVVGKMTSKGYIVYNCLDENKEPQGVKLTDAGEDIVETVFLNSEFREAGKDYDRYDLLAEKLRELYPKGKKPGTNYMWRDSNAVIAKKLKSLVKRLGVSFTDEQAINATKKYIASFNGDYRYMQLLKYFISKQVVVENTLEETSQFLSYIENEGQEDINLEWTVSVK